MNRRLFLLATGALGVAPGIWSCHAQPLAEPQAFAATSGDMSFDAWLTDFHARSLAAGLPREVLDRELFGLTPNPTVVNADRNQPEFSRPVSAYVKGAVSDSRVNTGTAKRAELAWLTDVEAQYGVPAQILIAIWGMESAFGAVQGDFDVVRTCATLAADGRRRGLFEENLTAALRIIASGEASRERLKGSGAGAMGQTQFMPTMYLSTAVDGDHDGRRDIWTSSQDALTSAANLLARAGWRRGESWQREVILPPGFDYSVVEGDRIPPAVWMGQGVKPADGYDWPAADALSSAQLITPSGAGGPAFLIFPNHFVIRQYNNSTSYALGVGLLASRIAGDPGVLTAWPEETGLSTAERTGAQEALSRLGYDVGGVDGIIGTNTRAALRSWQQQNGLPADGYLTPELSRRLQAQVGIATPVPVSAPAG